MSVIVKGMRMPECRDVCMFAVWSNLSQTASCKLKEYEPCFADFSNEYKSKRADFCPLVALPDKHGKLIDADALEPDEGYDDGEYWAYSVAQVCSAQAVIEAEDGS